MLSKTIKRIKEWFRRKFIYNTPMVKRLGAQITEVLTRALYTINRKFPDWLLDKEFPDLIEWIVEPHLSEEWNEYIYVPPEEDRGAERAVQKILEMKDKIDSTKESK